jgi:Carboxypeptidase regulatory-like domain
MKIKMTWMVAAALVAGLQWASAGDITGKITLKGTPPPEKDIPLDPSCGKLHTAKLKTRLYVVGKGGELSDVFVYIKDGLTGKTFPAATEPLLIDQKGCEYIPYIAGVQAKQKILVKNSDPLMHNVNVQPAVAGNKGSNRAQMAGMKPFEYVFEQPEIMVRYKCDVHPWMFAYVAVTEHPFFAVTDKDGNFTIKNVPPGKYVVEAVHRKTHANYKGVSQEVTVAADGAKADFVIELK